MMKIKNIIDIPQFIKIYSKDDISGTIESYTCNFCDFLINKDFDYNNPTFSIYIDMDNKISEFIDFYIDKSKLNNRYYCAYEEEKDLYQSKGNEIFKIELDNNTIIDIIILSYNKNEIIFKVYNIYE